MPSPSRAMQNRIPAGPVELALIFPKGNLSAPPPPGKCYVSKTNAKPFVLLPGDRRRGSQLEIMHFSTINKGVEGRGVGRAVELFSCCAFALLCFAFVQA